MVKTGAITSGMLPKVEACVHGAAGGVSKAHIIDGRIPHALLLEIYTRGGDRDGDCSCRIRDSRSGCRVRMQLRLCIHDLNLQPQSIAP